MSIDTIGDFLTVIRNGIMASKSFVVMPYSNMRYSIAQILKDEGFIHDAQILDDDAKKRSLKLVLKYIEGESIIHEITRVSKPGRRFYAGSQRIKPVIGGLGLSILSTNQGVITHKKARELGVGGEIVCTIW